MLKQSLDCIFDVKSVAIAGVSTKQTPSFSAGQRYLHTTLDHGFKGKVYPINAAGGEFNGLKIYANVIDIPEPVDYVISCLPASAAPQLVKDCVTKGVKAVQFFTSGFSETGMEEGAKLEKEICMLADASGMRIIGPNSMGVYCPKSNLSYEPDFPKESGSIALIAQSGGNSIYLVREASQRGLRFSKVVSYGNAANVNECELIEYLANDPDTEIILSYIEGVKNGHRFIQVLKEAIKTKPVILLKGGITEPGARAVASHTGSLAVSDEIWDGLLRQVGAIRVYSLDELIDMAVTFSFLPPLMGRRVGVLGVGGGAAVLATDDCTRAGLVVPRIPQRFSRRLGKLLKADVGIILNNPIDVSADAWDGGFYGFLATLADYGEIDSIMVHFPLGLMSVPLSMYDSMWNPLIEDVIKAHKELAKPVIVVVHTPTSNADYEWMLRSQKKFCEAGIPVYHSISSAAKAIDRFHKYHEYKLEAKG